MSPVTTIVISDPDLLAKLASAEGQIIFEGPTGDQVKTVETVPFGKPPPGFEFPITDEELDRRNQIRTRRTLADIVKEPNEKHGER
jgi:hypothetical protein